MVRYDHVAFACAVVPASSLCAVLQYTSLQGLRLRLTRGQSVPALRAATLRSKPTTYFGSAAFSRLPVAARTTKRDNSQCRCVQLSLQAGGATRAVRWPHTKRGARRVRVVCSRPREEQRHRQHIKRPGRGHAGLQGAEPRPLAVTRDTSEPAEKEGGNRATRRRGRTRRCARAVPQGPTYLCSRAYSCNSGPDNDREPFAVHNAVCLLCFTRSRWR